MSGSVEAVPPAAACDRPVGARRAAGLEKAGREEPIVGLSNRGVTVAGAAAREGPTGKWARLEMAPQRLEKVESCARRSWRDPAGGRPARVRGSARPLASDASSPATARAKRSQRSCGVWD